MMEQMPDRAFDVGIAEQHAVTLAAGMATQGLIPFCNIYSTFLQRAYDQVIHDVALQNLPVIFCLDRAGLVGQDGPTHHGVFDIAYLRCIPNLTLFAPMNEMELRNIMYTAQLGMDGPIAIRYPRGQGVTIDWKNELESIPLGTGRCLKEGSKIAILTVGHIGNEISRLLPNLDQTDAIVHYDMLFIKPLDKKLLDTVFNTYDRIITLEDGCEIGGFGSAVLEFANAEHYVKPVTIFGIPDKFVGHGTISETHKLAGIDFETIHSFIQSTLDQCE
jgi:1-deoxy-D-xylulose-5-phosphate synthase